jgi:hypothetical protein
MVSTDRIVIVGDHPQEESPDIVAVGEVPAHQPRADPLIAVREIHQPVAQQR